MLGFREEFLEKLDELRDELTYLIVLAESIGREYVSALHDMMDELDDMWYEVNRLPDEEE